MSKQVFSLMTLYLMLGCLLSIPFEGMSQGIRDSIFELNEVTIFADQFFQKEEAGQKVIPVDSMVLAEKANMSLGEVLSQNTPVFIKNHGRGALATASFRGTAASHTQVTWNGININSPMTGMVDFSLIPVYLIDEVSLKHGAASISDRSGGLGGSINISNNIDWNDRFALRYIQGIGSFSTYDQMLGITVGNNQVKSRTRAYFNYSANDYTFINRSIANIDPETGEIAHPVDTNDQADYKIYGLMQEIYWKLKENSIITARYWGQWAGRTIPRATSYEGPDNTNLNNQLDEDHKLQTEWKKYTSRSEWIIRSGYTNKDLLYSQLNLVPGRGLIPAIYSQSDAQSSLNMISYTYDIDRDFVVSARFDANYYQVSSEDTVKKTGYSVQRQEYSVLLTASKQLFDAVNISGMLRQEHVDGDLQPIIPFLGFDLRLPGLKNIILKGNIARNYHIPTLNDLYWQPGGNRDLLPEKGFTTELGLETTFYFLNQNCNLELTAYRSDITNWIIWIPTFQGFWQPQNINRVLSSGLETSLSLDGNIGQLNYRVQGTYAYTSSINYGEKSTWGDESYGKQLVYVPLHSGNMSLDVRYLNFYFIYQHNSFSERFTTSSNDVSRRDALYPYFMNDVSLGKLFNFSKIRINAELKIFNIFDESYHSILYRPMPGRNYLLAIKVLI